LIGTPTRNWDAKLLKEFVTITTHVPLIAVTKELDAHLLQKITCVMITTHALLIDVISRKDVSELQLFVTITMHVPLMFVLTDNVNTLMHVKMLTNVLYLAAAQQLDANLHQRTVTITTNVLKIHANQLLDVSTPQSHAMTMIHVPLITAAQLRDALTRKLYVMTKMHVQEISVKTENAKTFKSLVMTTMHVLMILAILNPDADMFHNKSKIQTCAPSELVMQLKELLIPQEFVKMETNVLSTTVMKKKDVKPLLNL